MSENLNNQAPVAKLYTYLKRVKNKNIRNTLTATKILHESEVKFLDGSLLN